MSRECVASIRLDRADDARGEILLEQSDLGFEIVCLTPEGEEDPSLPTFRSRAEALDAIEMSWGRGPWDLQWDV